METVLMCLLFAFGFSIHSICEVGTTRDFIGTQWVPLFVLQFFRCFFLFAWQITVWARDRKRERIFIASGIRRQRSKLIERFWFLFFLRYLMFDFSYVASPHHIRFASPPPPSSINNDQLMREEIKYVCHKIDTLRFARTVCVCTNAREKFPQTKYECFGS